MFSVTVIRCWPQRISAHLCALQFLSIAFNWDYECEIWILKTADDKRACNFLNAVLPTLPAESADLMNRKRMEYWTLEISAMVWKKI